LEVVSSLTEACKSRSLFLCSLHTLIGRSRVHNRTPLFSAGCLLPRVGRTDVLRSLVRFSCSESRMAGSSWRSFPVYWKLAKVGLSFSIHCILLLAISTIEYPQSTMSTTECQCCREAATFFHAFRCSAVSDPTQLLSATRGCIFLEVVSSPMEACESRYLFLGSSHTLLIGRSRVHRCSRKVAFFHV